MANSMLRITVKYCGGCNPTYDRTDIVAHLQQDYPKVQINYIIQDKNWPESDVVLVVSGCRKGNCFEYDNLKGKLGQILVSTADDYKNIVDFINNFS